MTNYELCLLLKEKKLLNAYQFYTTCYFKLNSAKISFNALKKLVDEYMQNEKEDRDKMFKQALEIGRATLVNKEDNKDFFGQEIPRSILIDKLTIEIFSVLHSFFDTFAQWVNSVLYGGELIEIKKVTLYKVIDRISSFQEYTGKFVDDLKDVTNADEYKYIADINNIVKHRYQIYTESRFNLFDGTGSVSLPKFHKDNNSYTDKEVLQIINDCIEFCAVLMNDSCDFTEQYYKSNDNSHVSKRIYNPKTYMMFENEEDYKKLKNVKNSIHYIEVDMSNILDEYHILLFSDDSENSRITIYNSVYPIIALKDASTDKYVGILKPDDTDAFDFNDGRLIEYRKYKSYTKDYEYELFTEMLNQNFKYYPYLSDCKIVILKGNNDEKTNLINTRD